MTGDTPFSRDLQLADAEATSRLGRALATWVAPGDTLLLSGEIGAGKSHLARALIQTLMPLWGAAVEDVPSPTFTLVQTYDTPKAEIWHADLYRITDLSELDELGLSAAFDTALCLVEWPDRLGPDAPPDALTLHLEPQGEGRRATLTARAPRWAEILRALPDTSTGAAIDPEAAE